MKINFLKNPPDSFEELESYEEDYYCENLLVLEDNLAYYEDFVSMTVGLNYFSDVYYFSYWLLFSATISLFIYSPIYEDFSNLSWICSAYY